MVATKVLKLTFFERLILVLNSAERRYSNEFNTILRQPCCLIPVVISVSVRNTFYSKTLLLFVTLLFLSVLPIMVPKVTHF